MNIGFVENVSEIGGAERMLEILVNGVRARGHAPFVTCPGPGKFPDLLTAQGFAVTFQDLVQPSWREPVATLRGLKAWSGIMRAGRWVIAHANNFHGARSVLPAAKLGGVPVICHVHFPFGRDYLNWVFRGVPKPAGFVFCSDDLRRESGAILKDCYPGSKQWVVHNGIDVTRFSTSAANNSTPRVGIIANLQERKGHEDFLRMAAILTTQGHDARYDIIGGDLFQEPRQPKLSALARDLNVLDRVTFHGQVSDVRDVLSALDVVVCASHEEAFPVSILEAMASGKPVVSTNVNGIPEAIENGSSGILVPPHAPEALASAVGRLLSSSDTRRSLGERGRARVEAHFTNQHFVSGVLSAYDEVLRS
ncbi:MAG TPA: glycosyltransferase [Vicinamibacterales bacterium]|nr:glycosyltransferase [Vicinamibacterales bacterium]